MEKNIYGVYFICCIGNCLDVVEEQMNILQKGLLNITKKVIIFITCFNEEHNNNLINLLNNYDKDNQKFIFITTCENLFEKFAINNYKKYINDLDYFVYYFHTKGVSKVNNNIMNSRRKLLNFYTLEKYHLNLTLLEKYDAVGCSLHLYPKKHFSGNFWWSKSTYTNTLLDINNGYLSPEMYILSNDDCLCISLANDTNDIIFDNYIFKSDDEILNNVNTNIIIHEFNKDLMRFCN